MAIVSSDIQFLLSAPQAGSGYTMAGVPGNSLGLYVSTTQLSLTTLNNLFSDITGAENAANMIDYACVFVFNNNADHAMLNPVAWINSALLGGQNSVTFAVGVDPTPPSILGSGSAQADVIANPTVAPTGVTSWAGSSVSSDGGIAVPNIPAKNVQALWIRRTCNGTPGLNQLTLDVTFDTLA